MNKSNGSNVNFNDNRNVGKKKHFIKKNAKVTLIEVVALVNVSADLNISPVEATEKAPRHHMTRFPHDRGDSGTIFLFFRDFSDDEIEGLIASGPQTFALQLRKRSGSKEGREYCYYTCNISRAAADQKPTHQLLASDQFTEKDEIAGSPFFPADSNGTIVILQKLP